MAAAMVVQRAACSVFSLAERKVVSTAVRWVDCLVARMAAPWAVSMACC